MWLDPVCIQCKTAGRMGYEKKGAESGKDSAPINNGVSQKTDRLPFKVDQLPE